MPRGIRRSPALRLLLCIALTLVPVGCTSFDAPDSFESDPASRRARLVATLETLPEDAEIYIVLRDGSEIRARYAGWHDEEEMRAKPVWPGWRATLFASVSDESTYRFEDIQYVTRSRLTMLGKVGAAAMTFVGLVALIQIVTMPRDDGP